MLVAFVVGLSSVMLLGGVGGCGDESSSSASSASSSSNASSGSAGGGGASSTAPSQNVAIGGCYDSVGCGVPRGIDDYSTCVSCATNTDACKADAEACYGNVDCKAILDCVVADCGDATCVGACEAKNPAGADLYRALLLCGYCSCNSAVTRCQDDLDALTPKGTCD